MKMEPTQPAQANVFKSRFGWSLTRYNRQFREDLLSRMFSSIPLLLMMWLGLEIVFVATDYEFQKLTTLLHVSLALLLVSLVLVLELGMVAIQQLRGRVINGLFIILPLVVFAEVQLEAFVSPVGGVDCQQRFGDVSAQVLEGLPVLPLLFRALLHYHIEWTLAMLLVSLGITVSKSVLQVVYCGTLASAIICHLVVCIIACIQERRVRAMFVRCNVSLLLPLEQARPGPGHGLLLDADMGVAFQRDPLRASAAENELSSNRASANSFDCKHLSKDIIRVCMEAASQDQLILDVVFPEHVPRVVIGGEAQVRQIINNFFSNVIGLALPASTITLEWAAIHPPRPAYGKYWSSILVSVCEQSCHTYLQQALEKLRAAPPHDLLDMEGPTVHRLGSECIPGLGSCFWAYVDVAAVMQKDSSKTQDFSVPDFIPMRLNMVKEDTKLRQQPRSSISDVLISNSVRSGAANPLGLSGNQRRDDSRVESVTTTQATMARDRMRTKDSQEKSSSTCAASPSDLDSFASGIESPPVLQPRSIGRPHPQAIKSIAVIKPIGMIRPIAMVKPIAMVRPIAVIAGKQAVPTARQHWHHPQTTTSRQSPSFKL